jgi:RimJ/RimL family protein N-acetyltransferase
MADAAIVTRATTADLAAVRKTRLQAMKDAPHAFASTLESEAAKSDADWRARIHGGAWFLAYRRGCPVGIVAGFPVGDNEQERDLVALWVEPAERGRSTATALVDAVVSWAREDGARVISLWVADGNTQARRLYERLGFAPTGKRQPLPSDPSIGEEQLIRPL